MRAHKIVPKWGNSGRNGGRPWTSSKKEGAKVGEGPRWGMMVVMEESHERSTKTVIIWSRNLVHKIIDKGERDGICD